MMEKFWEIFIKTALDLSNAKNIVEIGSDCGLNTENLCKYAIEKNIKLYVVDPNPSYEFNIKFKEYNKNISFHKSLSLNFLSNHKLCDAYLIDGDHNWYTVYNELKIIESKSENNNFPLIMFHDTAWPYARRDLYYDPENIPPSKINPYKKYGILPHQNELIDGDGINETLFNSIYEGTPKNGVLTAIEDFIVSSKYKEELILVNIPVIFGFSFLVKRDNLEKRPALGAWIEKICPNILQYNILKFVEDERISLVLHSIRCDKYFKNEIKALLDKIAKLEINFLRSEEELYKKETKIVTFEHDLDEKNKIIYRLEKDITQLKEQNYAQESKIFSLKKDVENSKSMYNSLLEDFNIEKNILSQKQQQLNARSTEIFALRQSLSWKITRPLRIVYDFLSFLRKFKIRKILFSLRYTYIGSIIYKFLFPKQIKKVINRLWSGFGIRESLFIDRTNNISNIEKNISIINKSISQDKFSTERSASYSAQEILYISGEPQNAAGNVYRVDRMIWAAEKNGWNVAKINIDELNSYNFSEKFYKIVIIWRAVWIPALENAITQCKANGSKIVFDIDDLMFRPDLAKADIIDAIRSNKLSENDIQFYYQKILETVLHSDYCFAPTEPLAHELRKLGKTSYVLKNSFDENSILISRNSLLKWQSNRVDNYIRIGYAAGTFTHQRDFGLVSQILVKLLSENPNSRLVLFTSNDPDKINLDINEFPEFLAVKNQIEWRNFQSLENLPSELARFDINIAPIEFGNPFCEAKSELKFFEAALVEVPTVASPSEPFRNAIKHGHTGFLATTPDDWYYYLKLLINAPSMREAMGRSAYYYVLQHFGPTTCAIKLGLALDQICDSYLAIKSFALQSTLESKNNRTPQITPYKIIFEKSKYEKSHITVVIPLYNYEKYILESLDSLFKQTIETLDIVIVDDCSTDHSLKIVTDWANKYYSRFNRILVLQNEKNYGLGQTRNNGFDAAETVYILPLDADNKLLPECCHELVDFAQKTGVSFVYPKIQQFGDSNHIMGTAPYDPQRFVMGNYIDAMALVTKEAWVKVGGYGSCYGWEDYDFWCKMSENALRGIQHPKILALYRVHSNSMLRIETLHKHKVLYEIMTSNHPWMRLYDYQDFKILPKMTKILTGSKNKTRLDSILPYLRCPKTKEKLTYSADKTKLVSLSGLSVWPILNERPIFSRDIDSVDIISDIHLSNDLPIEALEIIKSTEGPILNLSAGGTSKKYEHVIEVEYSIFRNTDIIADAHNLPFDDETFEAVIIMNAFEHYSDPKTVVSQIYRILKKGGKILLRTAFLQPLHEAPWHFYNCTQYGLEEWMRPFEKEQLIVTDNFTPNYTLSWIASEAESALQEDVSPSAAEFFRNAKLGQFVDFWRNPTQRNSQLWTQFFNLSPKNRTNISAGFQYVGVKK